MNVLLQRLSTKRQFKMFRSLYGSAISYRNLSKITRLNETSHVHIIPALQDNYMYVLIDQAEKLAITVDPVEPDKVLSVTEREKVPLVAVLTTHHHFDHAGGNEAIAKSVKDITIYGGDNRISCLTHQVAHGDKFIIGSSEIECLSTPCHTKGHICYFVKHKGCSIPICFTGDTLFVAGCGRFFEGDANDMLNAMNILSKLPPATKVYCGHEYTIDNLKFAAYVQPFNTACKEKLASVVKSHDNAEPTVPSTIGDELKFNPFMRTSEEEIQKFCVNNNPVDVMAILRNMKDQFVPP